MAIHAVDRDDDGPGDTVPFSHDLAPAHAVARAAVFPEQSARADLCMQDYHAKLLELITAVQEEIILTDDFPMGFKKMLDALEALTRSEFGFVAELLHEESGPFLKTYAISDIKWGAEGAHIFNHHVEGGFEFRNLDSLLGQTIATGATFISNAPDRDPNRAGLPPGHPKLNWFLSVPLSSGSTIVGLIGLANRPGGYDDGWREHLRPLSQTCGNLIVAKQADAERRQAVEMLNEALETIPDGFVIYDEDDRLATCNEAYRRLYAGSGPVLVEGTSFEDIIRYGLERGYYPDAGETTDERDAWLRDRLGRHRNPSGAIVQRQTNGTWLRIDERRTLSGRTVGLRSDVTELKEAEEAIRRSKAEASMLALVASRTDNSVIITDARGFIEWVNDGFTKMTGYSFSEVIGCRPGDLVQGSGTDPDAIVYMQSCLKAGVPFQLELINYHKTGTPYWVSVDVQPVRGDDGVITNFIAIQRDVTRQKSTERTLRQRETKFRSLFDMAPVGILLTAADGRFVDANDTYLQMAGEARDAMLGRHIGDLLDFPESEDQGDVVAGMLAELDENGRYGPVECQIDGPGGDRKTVLFNATSVKLMEQLPLIWSIVQDITERKRVERAKNEFISVVSHELRTPLTALVGSLGLVKESALGEVPAQVKTLVKIAQGNAMRLVDLVNGILEMEKIHSGAVTLDFEVADVLVLAEEAMERIKSFADTHGVAVRMEAMGDAVLAQIDRLRLAQVLNNLLSNAIKFSKPGQAVTMRIAPCEAGARISVEDQGCGIPDNMHEQIFHKFFQIDSSDSRAHNGSGLGLSVCQAIVEHHGSKIVVNSTEGQGATFYFDLPEADVIARSAAAAG